MMKIQLSILAMIGWVSVSFSQVNVSEKIVIKTPTVLCEDCKAKLEYYMKREPGISSMKIDIKQGTTTIIYLTDRNGAEQLKTAIANAGFDADEITAEETAYWKLPRCCRKLTDSIPPPRAPRTERGARRP